MPTINLKKIDRLSVLAEEFVFIHILDYFFAIVLYIGVSSELVSIEIEVKPHRRERMVYVGASQV